MKTDKMAIYQKEMQVLFTTFEIEEIFPLTPRGVLNPRSAHTRPFAWPPIDLNENFPPHMSAESPSNIEKH